MLGSTVLQRMPGENLLAFAMRTGPQSDAIRKAVTDHLKALKVESSTHPVFKDLPRRRHECVTEEESELHHQRAALRLKERYSQIPFYAERAAKDPNYWSDLAASAVNA